MQKSQTESYLNSLHCPPCQTHNFYNKWINLTSCFSTMVRNAAKLTTSPAGSFIKLRCGCRCWRLVVQDRRNTRGTSTWDNHQHVRVGGFSAGCRHANVSTAVAATGRLAFTPATLFRFQLYFMFEQLFPQGRRVNTHSYADKRGSCEHRP